MDRLTFEGNFCDIAICLETPGGTFCKDGYCSKKKVWERLKQYEDTGLHPGEVVAMRHTMEEYHKEADPLLRAKINGRLVELPCKIGDTVWGVKWANNSRRVFEAKVSKMYFSDDMRLIVCAKYHKQGEIGEHLFLTREEAEEELRKEGRHDQT